MHKSKGFIELQEFTNISDSFYVADIPSIEVSEMPVEAEMPNTSQLPAIKKDTNEMSIKDSLNFILALVVFIIFAVFLVVLMSISLHNNSIYFDLINYNQYENDVILNEHILDSDNHTATGLLFYKYEYCEIGRNKDCLYKYIMNSKYTVNGYQLQIVGTTEFDYVYNVDKRYDFVGIKTSYYFHGKINGDKLTAYCIYQNRDDVIECIRKQNIDISTTVCFIVIIIFTPLAICAIFILRIALVHFYKKCINKSVITTDV